MNRLSHALPLLLMLLLGVLSLWLKQAIESPGEGPRAPMRHEADARVDRFSVIQLDKDGKPELKLSAEHMVHYGDDDSTELAAPRLTKTAPEATLSVSADRGTVSQYAVGSHVLLVTWISLSGIVAMFAVGLSLGDLRSRARELPRVVEAGRRSGRQ